MFLRAGERLRASKPRLRRCSKGLAGEVEREAESVRLRRGTDLEREEADELLERLEELLEETDELDESEELEEGVLRLLRPSLLRSRSLPRRGSSI